MDFSVVGLPHYTIWHLYEPSVEDIKHMEVSNQRVPLFQSRSNRQQQMEQERLAREQEEKDKAEKAKKMKESFGDTTSQWEKDKNEIQNIALQDKQKEQKKEPQGGAPKDKPASQPGNHQPEKKDESKAPPKVAAR